MFKVFKKAKLADMYEVRLKHLDSELEELISSKEKLIKKLEKTQDERNDIANKYNDAVSSIKCLEVEIENLKSELNNVHSVKESKSESVADDQGNIKFLNGDDVDGDIHTRLSALGDIITSDYDGITSTKLREFFKTEILDRNDLTKSDSKNINSINRIYFSFNCLKKLQSYISKNGLTIRKK